MTFLFSQTIFERGLCGIQKVCMLFLQPTEEKEPKEQLLALLSREVTSAQLIDFYLKLK